MKKLKHILKLILLGPQPKDELYEEWSKDPLAEWFREQRKIRSWISHPSALRRVARIALGALLPMLVMIFASVYLLEALILPCALVMFLLVIALVGWQWKDKTRGTRPLGATVDLFWPTARVVVLTDMWMAGIRGRDFLKLVTVEGKDRAAPYNLCAAFAMALMALLPLVLGESLLNKWFFWALTLWVIMNVARFTTITSRNPFTMAGSAAGPSQWIPAFATVQNYDFTKEEVPGRIVPMEPVIKVGVFLAVSVCLVFTGHFPPWWLIVAILLPPASLAVYIHWYGRTMPPYDRQMLEQAFLFADREFDHWVRKELIGDEDARRE